MALFRPRAFLAPAALLAATALAYLTSFRGAFVFDDTDSILKNPTLLSARTAFFPPLGAGRTVEGRPLLNATLALNHAWSGDAPWSYHLVNLALHLAAAALLLALLRRFLPPPAAFAAALLWALHPLNTEAVTYIVQRAEILAALSLLAVLYCLCRYSAEPTRRRWAIFAVAACWAGMSSKETAAATPVLALLFDRLCLSAGWRETLRRRGGLHAALISTLLWLALLVAGSGSRGHTVGAAAGVPELRYLAAQTHALALYLRLCFWPAPLIFDYGTRWLDDPPSAWGILLALAIGGATLVSLLTGRWPRAGFLGAVFLAWLAPTMLIPGNRQTAAEHRLYLPAAAVVTMVVGLAAARRPRGAPWLCLLAIPLGAATAARNLAYVSAETLYRDAVTKLPDGALAHFDLGDELEKRGDLAGAAAEYAATVRLDPGLVRAYAALGKCRAQRRDWTGAEAAFRSFLALDPNVAEIRRALAEALQHQGRRAEAAAEFSWASLLDPSSSSASPSRAGR